MRSSEVPGPVHERGRDAYRGKDFNTALACFDRSIARGAPSAQLLDNRAACHEKLKKLPLALKDAKATIQAWREDPTGYLRAGKILVQMGKQTTAFEVLSHGLRTVKHVGQSYETLRKAHNDLQAKVAPQKSVDPMTMLPRELAEQVLEYLSFRQRMNACMVSMAWARFIRSVPNLWIHLDLSHARSKVKNAFVSRAINSARKKIQYATLTGKLESFDKTVAALLHHCNVRELTLLDAGIQSETSVEALARSSQLEALRFGQGTQLTILAFCDLLKNGPNGLKLLQCHDLAGAAPSTYSITLPSLRELDLRINDSQLKLLDGSELFEQIVNLTSLKVCVGKAGMRRSTRSLHLHLAVLNQLEILDLEIHAFPLSTLQLPPTIRNLTMLLCSHAPPLLQSSSCGLPALESFTLRDNAMTSDEITDYLDISVSDSHNTPCSNLRKLFLDNKLLEKPWTNEILAHDRLSDLKELGLVNNGACMDEVILAQPRCLRTVEMLNLSGTNVTGVGLRALLQYKQLERLIVNNCTALGMDAVEFARKQGIRVEHRMSTR